MILALIMAFWNLLTIIFVSGEVIGFIHAGDDAAGVSDFFQDCVMRETPAAFGHKPTCCPIGF